MFIHDLTLQNLKSHVENHLEPRRITIFIGPNSSGKSTILQSLLILKNALTRNIISTSLTSQNDQTQYGDYKDLVTNGNISKKILIALHGKMFLSEDLSESYNTLTDFTYSVDVAKDGLSRVTLEMTNEDYKIMYNWNRERGMKGTVKKSMGGSIIPETEISLGLTGFNPVMTLQGSDKFTRSFNMLFGNSDFTKNLLKEYYYVPPNRTATKYGVTLRQKLNNLPHSNPEQMISQMISNLSKDPALLDNVSSFIEELSGKRIRTRNLDLDDGQGVTLDFIKKNFSNSIINEGTGLNQLVLLLSILVESQEGSIVGIEEPEIHLHPKAQSKLAKILMNLAKKGRQLLITTHSEHMIYPFLATIASKNEILTKNDLRIYYVDTDVNGYTTLENLEINEQGQLRGGMKGFWDADFETFSEAFGDKDV